MSWQSVPGVFLWLHSLLGEKLNAFCSLLLAVWYCVVLLEQYVGAGVARCRVTRH